MEKVSVLIVCTANICRSPMAHGLLKFLLVSESMNGLVTVDSAGTHLLQKGLPPDIRAQQVAFQSGIDLSDLRSRKIQLKDFSRFNYILTMDTHNYRVLQELCPEQHRHKISMAMEFAPELDDIEVPDPYFSNIAGFERVFKMLEVAMKGVVKHIRQNNNQ